MPWDVAVGFRTSGGKPNKPDSKGKDSVERMCYKQVACLMVLAAALSACGTERLRPLKLPKDTRPLDGVVRMGDAPVENAEQVEVKTITFGEGGATSSRMVVTTRSIMDAESETDFLQLRAEIIDTDVDVSGARTLMRRKLAGRLQNTEGSIIEFDQDLQTGSATVRVIQHGAMITLNGEAAAKIASLIQQSYLAGRTVRQGQKVMQLDLSHVLSGIDPDTEEASLAGHVMGAARFGDRPVIVVGLRGIVDDAGSSVQVVGTYLVDKETGISIRGDITLTGVEMQDAKVHIAISQEVRL